MNRLCVNKSLAHINRLIKHLKAFYQVFADRMPGVVFLIVVPTANFEQEILNGKPFKVVVQFNYY